MKTSTDKNLDNKSNSRGFNKGKEPETFGPGDGRETGGRGSTYTNTVGATPDPNTDKGKTYEKRMVTPREPVLNAVPMPNKKSNRFTPGVLSYQGDGEGDCTAPADVPIGGTPKPNTIR